MSSKTENIIDKFAEWGTSDDFNHKLDIWMERNCESFRDAEISGEQKLIWGKKFCEYNDWLESELICFCDDEGVCPEQVFSSLQKALLKNKKEHRWFPIFMSCTVYENFLAEMRSRARELDTISSAACAARVDSDLNISGVWYHDPKYLDKKVLSKLMKLASAISSFLLSTFLFAHS